MVQLNGIESIEELMKLARRAIRSLKTCSDWEDIPEAIRLAMRLIRDMNKNLGHGIIASGKFSWMNEESTDLLLQEAMSLKKSANTFPGGYHKWATAGELGENFTTRNEILNFVRNKIGQDIVATSWNYNFYSAPGELAYPHIDMPHAPINALMMLSHNYIGSPKSKLVVYPLNSDPISLELSPGDFVLFWAGTTVHERTLLGENENVCIITASYNLKTSSSK